ncbi:MAG: MerR family transcriptional regulator [Acidimicrobiia bacterium]
MSDSDLVGIGAFAVLAGLSIPALRHYDEIGLFKPAVVDAASGYRRYRLDQVRQGRLIRSLRSVDLAIDDIRQVLRGDESSTRSLLVAHRQQLEERSHSLEKTLVKLNDYIENGVLVSDRTNSRICEINVGVENLDDAREFYEAVFAVEFTKERHGDGPEHLFAAFGTWPSDEFFLLNLSASTKDPYRAGRADFGFLVDDLEAVHQRAVAAGGTSLSSPADVEGMPRTSTIVDPSGNLINLYQNA